MSGAEPIASAQSAGPAPRCPICKSERFEPFNGRDNARCSGCKTMERGRLLWMVMRKLGLFRPALRVLHIAPELAFAKRFSELSGDRYHACDIDPARYKSRFTAIRPLDLTCDLVKLPSRGFDLIIHNHVLEHLKCDVEPVLAELERILAPGGHHFFSTPVSGELTREDLSDNLTPQHRLLLFGQEDHIRVFGARSITEMLARVWGDQASFHIEPLKLFSPGELAEAAIPEVAWEGVSSHSIFHHVRPSHLAVPPLEAPSQTPISPIADTKRAANAGGARLLLHIGMPKTGTSSLQRWLFANREANRALGLDYWGDRENHSEPLFLGFANDERIARGKMWFQRQKGGDSLPRPVHRARLDDFLDRLDGRLGILSGEAMWTFSREDVESLAEYLAERSVRTTVLCWVRRPAEYFVSAAQQRCRSDLDLADIASGVERKVILNFARLDAWLECFGSENVLVRRRSDDTVADFRAIADDLGVQLADTRGRPLALNPSISLTAGKALLSLNGWLGQQSAQGASERRSKLLEEILRAIEGEAFALPETTMRRMRARFAKETDYLAQRFSMPREDLREVGTALDDRLFFDWSRDEVEALLGAVNSAMLEIEALLNSETARTARPRPRPAAAARAASSAARSSPRSHAPPRKP